MNENHIMSIRNIDNNELMLWTESKSFKSSIIDTEVLDLINKAKEAGIEIPVGKENAITKSVLVEKIISKLTYTW